MSKELYEHLIGMPVDDIIAELDTCDDNDILDEEFERPLSSHETALFFQKGGSLTLDELNALMNKKIEEMASNIHHSEP